MKTIKESIVLLKTQLKTEVLINCVLLTPFMLAFQLMDSSRLFVEMIKNGDDFHELLEVLIDCCITFADIMFDAGADGSFIENEGSTADFLSPEMTEAFGFKYSY